MKTQTAKCEICGIRFERATKEIKRNAKIGRKTYCNLKCSGKGNEDNFGKYKGCGNIENFKGKIGPALDEYSMFRYCLRKVRARSKKRNIDYNISLDYIKDLWEKQGGICPLTGWELSLYNDNKNRKKNNDKRKNASLDRINSNEGYVKGNVRFIAFIANISKHAYTDKELLDFCKAVVYNQNS